MNRATKSDLHNPAPARDVSVVLGEDWVVPEGVIEAEMRTERERRRFVSVNRSPLARKIITFNLLALVVLAAGVLYLNPFRASLSHQREVALATEARLIADVYEAQLPPTRLAFDRQASQGAFDLGRDLSLGRGTGLFVTDASGRIVLATEGAEKPHAVAEDRLDHGPLATTMTDFLDGAWSIIAGMAITQPPNAAVDRRRYATDLAAKARDGLTHVETARDRNGRALFMAAAPIIRAGEVAGVVVLTSDEGEIDDLVRVEREQVLQMFVIAVIVSVGLSLMLASTIANPLRDLAAAAELGREKNARKLSPGRVRIPDLTARPDEIGRLSGAMRGMVAALYDRIDANEQFAADVAHEIKNPLASLRSAVGTLGLTKRDDQRKQLLDVIEHDVRRLDRLVSDISNASRLDSELVKEEEETFDLLRMLGNIADYLGAEAKSKGVDFIADLPSRPIQIVGLEARLAQVFVNIIGNAISFCEEGDAVRVWARQREDRVLVVVEDTGPGIPEQALTKVFKRFYSERPVGQFGNHSGLGLAISKQIVEAHGGVIWAENIRPTNADVTSEPLGARFVVGLPV